MAKVRVRFAPSPTGQLHLGGARTALFNYLFARKNRGKFILRFEDTDRSRSTKQFEQDIMESLKWLGLYWDEGPFYQMTRLALYKKAGEKMKKLKFAYEKEGALWLDVKAVIDYHQIPYRPVKVIPQKTSSDKAKQGYLIELPEPDLILGKISGVVEDFVLLRSNRIPTFHFAVVIDDEAMAISHVIRGQDHFSNTPKHYLLQKALGYKTPLYAHIPLILSPQRTKLSKRHGAVAIAEYRKMGYLPEALINFMVLLGWNPKTEEEFFSLSELEKRFEIGDLGKSPAIFNLEKLNFFNHYYLQKLPLDDLAFRCLPYFWEAKLFRREELDQKASLIVRTTSLLKERLNVLSEAPQLGYFLFRLPKYAPSLLIFAKSSPENTLKGLQLSIQALEKVKEKDWTIEKLQETLSSVVKKAGLSNGDVFWPVRVALSGIEKSPSPPELLWALEKKESLIRLKKALKLLSLAQK